MAKKKKRSEYSAPSTAKKTSSAAKQVVDGAADQVGDGASGVGASTAVKGSAGAGSVRAGSAGAASAATAGKTAGKARASAPRSGGRSGSSMSSNAQWGMVIAAMALIIGGVLLFSILGAGGGDGVLEVSSWDIPARADDTDNGDEDGRIKLADFSGTPTVVNFFASWCTECDVEMPYFTEVGELIRDQADMVFVNANEDSSEWRDMMERHDIIGNFPVGKDIKGTNRNGLLRNLGGNTGMPATAFFDANGRLVKLTRGLIEPATLQRELVSLGVQF